MAKLPPIEIKAPFRKEPLTELVRLGSHLGVDFTRTWDCIHNLKKPCGECHKCKARAFAFQNNDWTDPQIEHGWVSDMNKGGTENG